MNISNSIYNSIYPIQYYLFNICEAHPQMRNNDHWCVVKTDLSAYGISFEDLIEFLDINGALICELGTNTGSYFDIDKGKRVVMSFYPSIVVDRTKLQSNNFSIKEFGKFLIVKKGSKPIWLEDRCMDYDSREQLIASRNSSEYQEFRNMVLRRDRFCQCCGYDKNHKHMVVHHIMGFKNYPTLGYNEDNGIVLCKWCHEKYHSIYGKKNPNAVTFAKFMNKYGVIR